MSPLNRPGARGAPHHKFNAGCSLETFTSQTCAQHRHAMARGIASPKIQRAALQRRVSERPIAGVANLGDIKVPGQVSQIFKNFAFLETLNFRKLVEYCLGARARSSVVAKLPQDAAGQMDNLNCATIWATWASWDDPWFRQFLKFNDSENVKFTKTCGPWPWNLGMPCTMTILHLGRPWAT